MAEFTLPSGLEVETREVSLFALIGTGQIPNALLPAIRGFLSGGEVDQDEVKDALKDPESMQEFVAFFLNYAKRAMVKPKLVESDPGPGELSFFDLSDTDYVALFYYSQAKANAQVGELVPFRDEPGADARGSGDGAPLAPPAV
jgi:hypothetical protein